jgi:hypothetical protein
MNVAEVPVRPGKAPEVQLFDSASTRASTVAAFFRDGLAAGDTVLLVMTAGHWNDVAACLEDVDVAAASGSGQLLVRDAARTLGQFMRRGHPDAGRFDGTVGALLGDLAARGRPLRIYGEMVDLLAVRGDFDSAESLEHLWNDLVSRHGFTLFCGYSAVSFGDPRSAAALRRICEAHTHVHSRGDDVLAPFLLTTYRARSRRSHS